MGVTNLDSLTLGSNLVVGGNLTVTGTTISSGETVTDLTATGNTILGDAVTDTTAITGATTVTSTSASALAVGRLGATTPVLKVNAATSTVATGVEIIGAASGGNVQLNAIGGTNESLILAAKGSGALMLRSFAFGVQGAPTAKTVSATLTAVEMAAQIITVNQAAGGTSALQLPLATDVDTAFPIVAAGDSFDFSVINTSTVDAEDASITTNTGWTLVGSMDIHAYSAAGSLNSSALFRARKTGAGAWTLYRLS